MRNWAAEKLSGLAKLILKFIRLRARRAKPALKQTEVATCSAACGHLGEAVRSGLRVLAGEADPIAGSIRTCGYRGGKAGHEGKGSLFDMLLGQLFIQTGKNEMDISFTPHRKICAGGLDKCERQNYKAFRCLGLEDASVAPRLWFKTTILFCWQFCGSFFSKAYQVSAPLSIRLSPHLSVHTLYFSKPFEIKMHTPSDPLSLFFQLDWDIIDWYTIV